MKLVPGQSVILNGKEFVDEVPDAYLKEGQKERIEAAGKRQQARLNSAAKAESDRLARAEAEAKKKADDDAKAKDKTKAEKKGAGKE